MEGKIKIDQSVRTRLVLTQALRKSLEILGMGRNDLIALIEEELDKNPLLESVEVGGKKEPILLELPTQVSLYESLQAQIRERFDDRVNRKICQAWMESLDERGFATGDAAEISLQLDVPISAVEENLRALQAFDPPGIFARDLREVILIQLKRMHLSESVSYRIVESAFDLLLQRQYSLIRKKLELSDGELREAIQRLSRMSTRPSSSYFQGPAQLAIPDVRVYKAEGKWRVELAEEGIPRFQINAGYLQLKNLSQSERETMRGFSVSAKWLMRSIANRKKLMLKLTSYLVQKQQKYLDQEGALAPISASDLAGVFGVHESTISRILSEKFYEGPCGIFPLKSLVFSGENEWAKEVLLKLISSEDGNCPLTDERLAEKMAQAGWKIARRTIAKYRKQLNIQSASARKQLS